MYFSMQMTGRNGITQAMEQKIVKTKSKGFRQDLTTISEKLKWIACTMCFTESKESITKIYSLYINL
jgi:hypothetical protein